MADVVNKYADTGIAPRVDVHAERVMLRNVGPEIILGKMGTTVRMPKNKSQTIKWRRKVPFTAKTVPLVEGVTPDSDAFDYEDVSGTLKQYGQVVKTTDVVADTHEDPVLNDMSEESGKNIGRTLEAIAFGVLKAGTTVFRAGGVAARTDINTPITINGIRNVTRTLRGQKARKITKVIQPGMKYETRGVEAAYVCVAHTDCEADLRNLPGFKTPVEYGSFKPISEYECGMVENVRFLLSADLDPWTTAGSSTTNGMVATGGSVDVYPYLFFGEDAFGHVALNGMGAISPTIIPPNKRDKSDPLGQIGYVGWKTWYLCQRLNENWMARYEAAVTDLA